MKAFLPLSFFLFLSSSLSPPCLPPSAFREVGQLTVCSCQVLYPPPLRGTPPPLPLTPSPIGELRAADPAFQRDVTARYKDKSLTGSERSLLDTRVGKSQRGEPLNLCGAELEKLLLSEKKNIRRPLNFAYLLLFVFLAKKRT